MAQSDWTECSDNLSDAALKFRASGAYTPPPGGGTFCGAFRSLTAAIGNRSYFYNGAGFVPMPKGGIMTGALKRSPSAGSTGFAPYLFALLQGTANTNDAYILGLADNEPSHLVLRKGALVGGLPDVDPVTTSQGVLWRSDDVWQADQWGHFRLMVKVNLNGDAVISVWFNDLEALGADVTTPVWTAVQGINLLGVTGNQIIDDDAGINTGTTSLKSGRIGFGMYVADVNRVAMVDHLTGTSDP